MEAADAAGISTPNELSAVDLRNKPATINAVKNYVEALMAEDRKSTGLKALQGHIWRAGFESGELRSELYPDFPPELERWHQLGIKTYIYSSGSREAQKHLFAHSTSGDLRQYLSGFFDTTVGPKLEARSYKDIALTLGADEPAALLFATDSLKEAEAAKQAGWSVALTTRPGNAELPEATNLRFRVISSMAELLVC